MTQESKEKYVSPETEVVRVSTESPILQLSGGTYPSWFSPEDGPENV